MPKSFVFFGTPYVARDTLAYLVSRGHAPKLVITSPDAPRGRWLELAPSETKAWADGNGLPVFAPQKLDEEALARIRSIGADYAIVVAYGKILPQALIDSFPQGVLNIHYSLLPKYRGASPVEAALLAGDQVTGVSIQKMVYALDAGDVLASEEAAIGAAETTKELRPRLGAQGAELHADKHPAVEENALTGVPQKEADATKCGRIDKKEGELDLAGDALMNWNKYRAYAESPGTYFYIDKGRKKIRLKLKTAKYEDGVFTPLRVVPEGKKETDYSAFLRGMELAP